MTLQQAQDLIRSYQRVLADDDRRGVRRDPFLLPATKDNLMRAIQLEIAQLHFIASDTDDFVEPLIRSAMVLDSFTLEPLDTAQFVANMHRRRAQLETFHHDLRGINRQDPFYWQRVYALLGVSTETKNDTLFDTIKRKLGLAEKEPAAAGSTSSIPKLSGRIVLD